MSVRITGGELRGRVLGRVPEGVRPTHSRAREALFSMVGQDLSGWSVLDAFGGTGLLAFEAVSRRAGPALVVERDREIARRIRASALDLGLTEPTLTVRQADAAVVLRAGRWDLVLLDPPYAEDPLAWARLAAPAVGRLLVFEHRSTHRLPEDIEGLRLDRARTYGDTTLSLFRPRPSADQVEDGPIGG